MFVGKCEYVAAWPQEVSDGLLDRTTAAEAPDADAGRAAVG